MLRKRIVPCLDLKEGKVVKGVKFLDLVSMGDPAAHALYYNNEGADELVILDITASHEARGTLVHVVEAVAENLFIPLTVGGGVRTADDVRALLLAGADRVSLNTSAVSRPALISDSAERFGTQCIVAAIDARRREPSFARLGRLCVRRKGKHRERRHWVGRRSGGEGRGRNTSDEHGQGRDADRLRL